MWFQHRRFQIVFSVFENLILHIFPIIIIIIPCSGMFRDVPECSGIFHFPGFIDAPDRGKLKEIHVICRPGGPYWKKTVLEVPERSVHGV